jgi:hypothetical protein
MRLRPKAKGLTIAQQFNLHPGQKETNRPSGRTFEHLLRSSKEREGENTFEEAQTISADDAAEALVGSEPEDES